MAGLRALLFIHPCQMDNPGRYSALGVETMLAWPAEDAPSAEGVPGRRQGALEWPEEELVLLRGGNVARLLRERSRLD